MSSVAVARGVSDWTMRDWEHRLCGDPTRLLDELAEPGETYQTSNPTKALLAQLVSTAA